ncbi:MAG: fimbrillin family protein, partial [Muribaculaceae bacterium]|nr:fimbrillin family protein [Muribaculaceae bacterium]
MKKSIFFAALAAAAVAMPSCSNDEGVEVNQGDAIKFNVFAGKTSRAVAIENNTISQFHIWGVAANNTGDFFMNCDVKKEGDLWTYSPTKFWPQ